MEPEFFLDDMHLAAEAPLERGFMALSTTGDDQWFLPLQQATVKRLDFTRMSTFSTPEEFQGIRFGLPEARQNLVCKERGGVVERVIHVCLTLEGQTVEKAYPQNARNRDAAGNELDIRVWPNFAFLAEPPLPEKEEDRVYYFRIRQEDSWNLRPLVLARVRGPQGEYLGAEFFHPGNSDIGWPDHADRFRRARFYSFPARGAKPVSGGTPAAHCEPIGLYFEGRGLLLFRLENPVHPGGEPVPWRIGVDFGTSNTCVTFRSMMQGVVSRPEVIQFDIQTTTLHALPVYQEVETAAPGEENEGAAAVFDFPYRYAGEPFLTENVYFPSQLVTRQESAPTLPNFRLSHGLIFPRNAVLDNKDIRSHLYAHPPLPAQDSRVFRLMQDIKWGNRAFRRPFLWHLYKMVVLHAARNGARVTEAAFSFPRAFTRDEVRHFTNEVRAIFQNHGKIHILPADIVSESVAVQRWVEAQAASEDQLVLDIGGGTTDYLGVIGEQPTFQASYSLAAGCVNDYFRASKVLRRLLRDGVYEAVGKPAAGTANNRQREQRKLLNDLIADLDTLPESDQDKVRAYSQQALFGLLAMLEERHMHDLGNLLRSSKKKPAKASDSDVLHGFFLTLLLLYAGLVHQAARLMKQHNFLTTNLRVDMIGNGSRYCRLLGEDAGVLKPLFEKIIQAAGSNPEVLVKQRALFKGKTVVAEGLVLSAEGSIPAPVIPDKPTLEYLKSSPQKMAKLNPVHLNEQVVFVQVLDKLLKAGKLNGILVVPHCHGTILEEVEPLLAEVSIIATDRERGNAVRLKDALQRAQDSELAGVAGEASDWRESAYAVEPVFITRLRCLLDLIRQKYAA